MIAYPRCAPLSLVLIVALCALRCGQEDLPPAPSAAPVITGPNGNPSAAGEAGEAADGEDIAPRSGPAELDELADREALNALPDDLFADPSRLDVPVSSDEQAPAPAPRELDLPDDDQDSVAVDNPNAAQEVPPSEPEQELTPWQAYWASVWQALGWPWQAIKAWLAGGGSAA